MINRWFKIEFGRLDYGLWVNRLYFGWGYRINVKHFDIALFQWGTGVYVMTNV